jgi:hypothetical protein
MSDLKVVKTDTLVVEYVELPMHDLNSSFIYRFMEPIPTVWQMGRRSLYEIVQDKGNHIGNLSTYFLSKWREMLPPDLQPPLGWENQDYMWLYDVNKTLLIKCHIEKSGDMYGFN